MSHVATINGRHWPAARRPDGLLIDFRLFGPEGPRGGLFFLPDELAAAGVPHGLIRVAALSAPQGFVLWTEE
jgi:hypothetical protein